MTRKKPQDSDRRQPDPVRTKHARVLVVDDNIDLLKLISIRLKPMQFELKTVTSAEEALSTLSVWSADLVITDLQMEGMSGMDLFNQIQLKNPLLPVIVLTAHGTIPEAVEATQSGVASYLTKPFDSRTLLEQIQGALLRSGFTPNKRSQQGDQHKELVHDERWRSNIIGKSSCMQALLQQVESLAEDNSLVCLEGEVGTGKDEIARAMHARSDRASNSLVHLSCTSVPPELLEIEVFGRVGDGDTKPARRGLLKQVEGGTLIFSDFNETSVAFVRRVLIALEAGLARPVDSEESYPINVRVIATSAEIGEYGSNSAEIWELCDRLGMTVLRVPPLRERREDIPLLVNYFLETAVLRDGMQFSPAATQQLLAAGWPGNVRQLLNLVKQCAQLSKTDVISEALANTRIGSRVFQIQPLSNAQREFERNYLIEVLKVTHGNVTKAAAMAKRNRTEFHRLLKKHKIEAKTFRLSS